MRTGAQLRLVATIAATATIVGGMLSGAAPRGVSIALLLGVGVLYGLVARADRVMSASVVGRDRPRRGRVWAAAARLLAVTLLVPLMRIANHSRESVWYSLTVLAVGVFVIATMMLPARTLSASARPLMPTVNGRAVRGAVAVCVFIAALAASWVYMSIGSTPIAPDTGTYWATVQTLLQRTPGYVSIRTPIYSAMFALVHAAGGSGLVLIALQFVARALGAALVAYLLARSSLIAATVVGLLLALDPVSAAMSVYYLTESLYTSGMMLGLVLVIGQLQRPRWQQPRMLVCAGILFGVAFLFRPSGIGMLLPTLGAYWLVTRSVARTGAVLGGFSVTYCAIALFNFFRSGVFTVAATGLYVAFPLFSQHLFDPDNGPTSAAMHRELVRCHPDLDYEKVVGNTSNEYIHGKFTPCLIDALEGDRLALYDMYGKAYREALMAQPLTFVSRMSLEAARFLSVSVAYYAAQVGQFAQYADLDQLCRREGPYSGYREDFIAFICPLPPADAGRTPLFAETAFATRMLYQPYLYVYDPRLHARGYWETSFPEMTGAVAILYFGLVLAVTGAAFRPWVAGAAVVAVYNAAVTAVGQVTMLRYVAMDSPFFLLITGLFMACIIEDVAVVCTGGRVGGQRT